MTLKKIIWVDDQPEIIDPQMPIFYDHGFNVLKATSVTQALNLLRNEGNIDGIILDVRLGKDENGLDLLNQVRQQFPSMNAAILTAYPSFEDHARIADLEGVAYFGKIDMGIPVDPQEREAFFSGLHELFPSKRRKQSNRFSSLVVIGLISSAVGIIGNLLADVMIEAGVLAKSEGTAFWIILLIVGILISSRLELTK